MSMHFAGGGGGIEKLAEVDAAGDAWLGVTNLPTEKHSEIRVSFGAMVPSVDQTIHCQIYDGADWVTAANHKGALQWALSDDTTGNNGETAYSGFRLSRWSWESSGIGGGCGFLRFPGLTMAAVPYKHGYGEVNYWGATGLYESQRTGFFYNGVLGACTGLRLYPASGVINAGRLTIWGVR